MEGNKVNVLDKMLQTRALVLEGLVEGFTLTVYHAIPDLVATWVL